ncbi:MAG: hypothetical protein LBS74_11155 [Oscillospiraceae bacterium]|jgi:hypothetical protein|nr:hypothetical protein [Oscillospiraceae bacterium]
MTLDERFKVKARRIKDNAEIIGYFIGYPYKSSPYVIVHIPYARYGDYVICKPESVEPLAAKVKETEYQSYTADCPNCKELIDCRINKFCHKCGLRLDWS